MGNLQSFGEPTVQNSLHDEKVEGVCSGGIVLVVIYVCFGGCHFWEFG